MSATSLQFILYALGVSAVLRATATTRAWNWVFAVASTCYLLTYYRTATDLTVLVSFICAGYVLVRLSEKGLSTFLFAGALGLFITLFLLVKQYSMLLWMNPLRELRLQTFGLSYMLFRVVHVMIDVWTGVRFSDTGFLSFFNYVAGFPVAAAGPIQRYDDFLEQRDAARLSPVVENDLISSLFRVAWGMFKVAGIGLAGRWLQALMVEVADKSHGPIKYLAIASAIVLFFAYLYFNFSGSIDIAIGIGRIIGFRLPENFDDPVKAKDFLDFWGRWHITLSKWFQTYLFGPIVSWLTRLRPEPKYAPYWGVVGYLAAFTAMGIWHGSTWVFIFYGIWLGSAAAINKLYQIYMTRVLGKAAYKALKARPPYIIVSRAVALGIIAIGLVSFWMDTDRILSLAQGLGITGCSAVAGMTIILCGAAAESYLLICESLGRRFQFGSFFRNARVRLVALSFMFFVAIVLTLRLKNAPVTVYQEF